MRYQQLTERVDHTKVFNDVYKIILDEVHRNFKIESTNKIIFDVVKYFLRKKSKEQQEKRMKNYENNLRIFYDRLEERLTEYLNTLGYDQPGNFILPVQVLSSGALGAAARLRFSVQESGIYPRREFNKVFKIQIGMEPFTLFMYTVRVVSEKALEAYVKTKASSFVHELVHLDQFTKKNLKYDEKIERLIGVDKWFTLDTVESIEKKFKIEIEDEMRGKIRDYFTSHEINAYAIANANELSKQHDNIKDAMNDFILGIKQKKNSYVEEILDENIPVNLIEKTLYKYLKTVYQTLDKIYDK